MAIIITRRLAQQLRAVMRRAFSLTRSPGPPVCLSFGPDGLRARARFIDVAVEYHDVTAGGATGSGESLWVPFQLLDDCQGGKDDPVQIEAAGQERIAATWQDRNVPQLPQYDCCEPADADPFPGLPETLAENPARIVRALVDAGATTDPESARYALGCLRLRGNDGSIAATDGRQLLVQRGFHFPWSGDVLLPRNKVFGSSELAGDVPVAVGKVEEWLVLRIGPWRVHIKHDQHGRFPSLDSHIPRPELATACCRLSPGDARFLAEALPRLPCDDTYNDPITLDLNGAVVIRARAADQAKPTEAVATHSTTTGEPIRVNTNRAYLTRALKLGFRELCLFGDKVPAACFDGERTYLWALLDPESAIPPAADAIRIESQTCGPNSTVPQRQPRRRINSMSESATNQNGNGHAQPSQQTTSNGHKANGQARKLKARKLKASQQDIGALIEQTEALRQSLRDTLAKSNELLKGLKQHRRATRTLETTLGALRQLKGLGV